jgi:hypothetical protein
MTNASNYAKNDCCLFSLCFGFVARAAFISSDHHNKNKVIQHSSDIA